MSDGSQAPVGKGGSEAPADQSIFLADGERFAPTEHARGPWDPRALHGGAPAALITSAFESVEPGSELQIARLGFELLRPVPFAPLEISTSIVRAGRRVQELTAEMRSGDELICRASAMRVQAVPSELPEDLPVELLAGLVHQPSASSPGEPAPPIGPMPGPEHGTAVRFALDDLDRASFAASAMEMRWIDDPWAPGPGRVWMRLRHPLIPGQELTPLARLAATADFANGVSAVLPFDRFLFINADLTIHLQRQPRGEWIGLDARTILHEGGTGLSDSVLHDEHGPVGRSFQTLVVQAR